MPDPDLIKQRNHWIFDLDGTLTVSAHDFEHIHSRSPACDARSRGGTAVGAAQRAGVLLCRQVLGPVVKQTLEACRLQHFFPVEHILDRDACIPKPSPDGVRHLLQFWGADADDTVMVGDYLYDLEAGKGAGVATIHVDTRGDVDWSEYTDIRVEGLGEIIEYLQESK
jgi:phosphoglycolate phosphatase-like HAD superfamily hydrolase